MNIKQKFRLVALMVTSLLLASCSLNDKPKPKKDPIYLSSEAQTYTVKVKHLTGIYSLHPDIDTITECNVTNQTQREWKRIENEWINIYFVSSGDSKNQSVKITVKQNSGQQRKYTLGLSYRDRESTLTIIQKAK